MRKIKIWIMQIMNLPCTLRNRISLKINRVSVGIGTRIYGLLKINNKGSIVIGKKCVLMCSPKTNKLGQGVRSSLIVSDNGKIEIGDNTKLSNFNINCRKSVVIENDVMIGGGTCIWDSDFHSVRFEMRISENDTDIASKPIRIKKGAFIGSGCLILKGVTIGEESVVGAGSVVTKNIPDKQIWAGNPAKFIKTVP